MLDSNYYKKVVTRKEIIERAENKFRKSVVSCYVLFGIILFFAFTFLVPMISNILKYNNNSNLYVSSFYPLIIVFLIAFFTIFSNIKKSKRVRDEIKAGKFTKENIKELIDEDLEVFELEDFIDDSLANTKQTATAKACDNSCVEEGNDIFAKTREENKTKTRDVAKAREKKPGKIYCKHCGLEMLYDDDKCEWCGEDQ